MKNLIFDFDGVLGDTWDAVVHGLVSTGKEETVADAINNMQTYAAKRPHHAKGHSLSQAELADYRDWMIRFGEQVHQHGFELFDSFVNTIEQLEDMRMAIVSSGSQNYVLPALAKTELRPTHVLAYEDHHSKEEKVDIVTSDWGITANEAYYFTDTLADVYELQDLIAPDKLIGVSWGYCTKEQLLSELPEKQVLKKPTDIHLLF